MNTASNLLTGPSTRAAVPDGWSRSGRIAAPAVTPMSTPTADAVTGCPVSSAVATATTAPAAAPDIA